MHNIDIHRRRADAEWECLRTESAGTRLYGVKRADRVPGRPAADAPSPGRDGGLAPARATVGLWSIAQ